MLAVVAGAALFGATAFGAAAQQAGTVEGVVTDAQTQTPISGAQVFVVGTQRGSLTAADGSYRITGITAGEREIRVQRLGYTSSTQSVTVGAGATVALDFALRTGVVDVEEMIVTGVAGETARSKIPFTVSRLDAANLPVPSVSAGSAIQGKVAGATVVQGSGRPGSAPSILLRGPTSINASGRDQEPLYIVDGVILGSSMVDIDGLDIESIEVVKGAAAASMYGSRAQSGVIQITTRRGRNVADDQVRYTLRSEVGQSELPGRFNLTQRHQFRMTPDGSQFIDGSGNPCDWLDCPSVSLAGQRAGDAPASNWNTFQTQEWPGQTFDHVDRFFRDGRFLQNYVSAQGRSGATNYHVSFSNLNEGGIMPGQEGFRRNNFRLNLDQAVLDQVNVSASAFYSRSIQDQLPESQGNPIFLLTRMPAGVDLEATDAQGNLILEPDPFNENANPLYEMRNRQYDEDRGRFLGSANVRWTPITWLSLDANASYDRLDRERQDYYPKGFRTIRPNASLNEGSLFREYHLDEALNASVTGTARQTFGDLNTTLQLRYLYEQQDREWTGTSGSQFAVSDIAVFDNIDQNRLSAYSTRQPIRADGFFAIADFDYLDRYILSTLVRNDGSSLFGPDERRHWYHRIAGAWRMGEEPWFNVPAINEARLRYSYGTAGGRPNFAAQYETFSVTGGAVTPVTLGNRALRPEHSIEQEVGAEVMFLDRFALELTYAATDTRDQILSVPALAYTGYASQWQNAGTLSSNTFEASFDAQVIQRPNFSWSTRLLYDRTRQEITQLDVPAYTYGVAGQNMGSVFYAREGEALGTFYGTQFATHCDHLPSGVSCAGFDTNDDGLLVWVGEGNSWRDALWGTSSADAGVLVRGAPVMWGSPIGGECVDRATGDRTTFCPLGRTTPDYQLSMSNTLNWHGFSLYGLLDAVQGFQVYNQPLQWSTFQQFSGIMDQTGVPEAEQKPVGYYANLYGVSGLAPSSRFVEDASFVKLRELSARYRFAGEQLAAVPGIGMFDGITVSLTGRNLLTWTSYDGYDPEVGRAGGSTGSAALARVDGYNYPNFRTWTLGLELNF